MHHDDLVPRLTDGVVALGAHRVEDIATHVAGEDEETARRFGWWPQRSTADDVARSYEEWATNWRDNGSRRTFAVRDADGRLVGGCELRMRGDRTEGEVSYWTNADSRGRGYATRALALLASYAEGLGLRRLESHVAADNLASRRVAEQAGFDLEADYIDESGEQMVRYARRFSSGSRTCANGTSGHQ